jgi:hypothetical protein
MIYTVLDYFRLRFPSACKNEGPRQISIVREKEGGFEVVVDRGRYRIVVNTNKMEDIDVACRAFTKSVDEYINRAIARRRKRQRQKQHDISDNDDDEEIFNLRSECNLLVEHANLVLYTLSTKRNSLSNAIQAFRAELTSYIERFVFYSLDSNSLVKNSNSDGAAMQQQVEVVRRWFANYVRLRDGFVLLESGERRHDHDDDHDSSKSSSSFPSMLKGALRPDGRTRKFKSDKGYTGRGYDEVYDDDVGIKRRLLQTLAKLDSGRRSITTIDEKLFDDETGGATKWQMCMDEHISQSKILREELNCIANDFVVGINRHLLLLNSKKTSSSLSTKTTIVTKLTLNTDDKFERIKLGDLIDISRRGNDFSIKDKGGSLPIGMSLNDWKVKFSLIKVLPNSAAAATDTNELTQKNKIENVRTTKKRKMILEDSSEDSDDDNNVIATAAVVAAHSTYKAEMDTIAQDDGLMVRKRMATNVSSDNHHSTNHVNDGHDENHITTSIDEMKRQLGVNTVELQRGHDQLEDEQLLSSMAANEEDMINGVLLQERGGGDMVIDNSYTDSSNYSILVPLLKQCYFTRNEVRKNMHNLELLREMQDIFSDFDDTAKCWNDHLQTLIELRSNEIAKGLLTETSDRVSVPFFFCVIL